jgi:large subunit ribosomal protein L17
MRHRNAGRQFSRNTSHRKAMFRALTANLVAHERIETTDAKAKELKRVAERLITHAIRLGDVAFTPQEDLSAADKAKRQAAQQHMGRFLRRFAVVRQQGEDVKIDLVEKVFLDLARRFKGRPGGYTRIIKLGHRRGDNAPMALVEWVVEAGSQPHRPGKKEKKPKAEAAEKTSKKAATKSEAGEKKASKKTAKAAAG